jgi:hypothetical protein
MAVNQTRPLDVAIVDESVDVFTKVLVPKTL